MDTDPKSLAADDLKSRPADFETRLQLKDEVSALRTEVALLDKRFTWMIALVSAVGGATLTTPLERQIYVS